MARELTIYSIYRLKSKDKYYLLRTERPEYPNPSQNAEDIAYSIEQNNRKRILKDISPVDFDLVGELQSYPIGEALYADSGQSEIDIYYMETEFGHPWVVLGNAASEDEFLSELNDDEDLLRLMPTGQPIKIRVTFLTENDFRF